MAKRFVFLAVITLFAMTAFAQRNDLQDVVVNTTGQAIFLDEDTSVDGVTQREIKAFDASGDVAWTYVIEDRSEVWDIQLRADVMTFIRQNKGEEIPSLVALDSATGVEKWALPVEGSVRSLQASGEGYFLQYISNDDVYYYHNLAFIDADGKKSWDRVIREYARRDSRRVDQDNPNAGRN